MKRINALLDEPLETLHWGKGIKSFPSNCEINFRDVDFTYGDYPVLKKLNLYFPSKKMVAIIGPSGGGKSTIFKLIERLYEPNNGKIHLSNNGLNEYNLSLLRKNIGYVSQDIPILDGAIRDNMLYGAQREFGIQELNKVLVQANMYQFVHSLEDGLDTRVGERGIKLSGGQKQRIAITRVLLKSAPIILLDEATSSLDPESEGIIQACIGQLANNKTVIVIAHRLSTVINADKIYVIDNGEVIGEGSHQELYCDNHFYKDFANKQLINNMFEKQIDTI